MKIHFIGIGGIGVSALARYYLEKGHVVSGSDLSSSEITQALEKIGVQIGIPKLEIQNQPDLIIYSPAVKQDDPELKKFREAGIKCQSYPQALGELTKKYFTIAISGTHGKSTTTAMIGLLLTNAGLDPTVIVGTKLKEFNDSNCRVGKGQYLVIEADEHFASFLNYWPKIIVLTTIEEDHLDYYKNLENILKAFQEYIGRLPKEGILVINQDDKNSLRIKAQGLKSQFKTQNYSFSQLEAERLKKILQIPGLYNIYNALAALTVARLLKIPDETSFASIAQYKGAWRRFELKETVINNKKITIISDYGHHPTEVRVTLEAAREKFPDKKIICVFQPHQYQRTFYLFDDFVKKLSGAPVDKLIITDIYDVAGREEKEIKEKVSSQKLVKKINEKKVIYLPREEIKDYLKKNINNGEVLIIMGAGNIYNLTCQF